MINITDSPYNAVGDGVMDDTTAIQDALDAVPTSPTSGAIVYAPPGTYVVSSTLYRKVSFTRFVGAGKNATIIMIANNSWAGFNPPSGGGFVFDLKDGATECSVENLTIDGNDRGQAASNPPAANSAGGINCSAREFVNRVSLYDIFGWSIWFGGQSSEEAQLVDCDADSPATGQRKGNDTIGGLGHRNKVIRFHWKPTLAKLDALDLTNGGGGGECSVDIINCINESGIDILLEGCTQSSVVGCRFYNNTLRITSDAKYTAHNTITNPRDIVVERCLFQGAGTNDAGPEPALGQV
ncbi:MAG: glycosyl hydrolase family 28-related protein [Candidatus Cybelea sp.]